jgi:hypothetical protein
MWRDRNQIDPDLAEISKEEIDDDKDDDTSMLLN